MKKQWTAMKTIIQAAGRQDDLFLSLIDEDGVITCANANMLHELELQDPRNEKTNFFDLIHPAHRTEFKNLVNKTYSGDNSNGIELYIKNGHYHPMKWNINYLAEEAGSKKTYLCLGYNILDEKRLKKFNNLVSQNYQLLIENLSGIIFHDKNGEIVATNQKTASIFNTSLEQIYKLNNIEALWQVRWNILDEDGQPIPFEKAPFIKAIRTNKAQQDTLHIRLLDGEERWVLFNSQPLPETETKGDFAVITSIIDVTNERLLSRRLQERESLINSFFKQTTQLAWVVDEHEKLQVASTAFYDYFGIDEEESVNKKVTELLPSDVINAVYDQHRKVLETGKAAEISQRVKWADGSDFISYINLFSLGTQGGTKLLGGSAIQVPDKSRLEKELDEAHERLINLSKATSDAIWEWDMQTGNILQNDILLEMTGYMPDMSRGISWWLRCIHREDRDRIADKVKETIENSQQSWQDEYRFKCADGSYKHIRDKGFITYENGLPVKMIGSLHDISSVKDLENKLADEKMKRQKEVSEAVIRAEEKERTQIGRELHDNVNQLLSAIKLFVDVLTPFGKEQKVIKQKCIEYTQMAIDEIRKLSNELVAPQLKEKGLTESIRTMIDDIELASDLKIRFIHDLESDLLSEGKKTTLFRIVQEQLKNIIKHSRAKNTSISLQNRNNHVELVIVDDGTGFDPKQTRRGIGLSNIQERVHFYNGAVEIQAAPGKGCTMTITIPVTE